MKELQKCQDTGGYPESIKDVLQPIKDILRILMSSEEEKEKKRSLHIHKSPVDQKATIYSWIQKPPKPKDKRGINLLIDQRSKFGQ